MQVKRKNSPDNFLVFKSLPEIHYYDSFEVTFSSQNKPEYIDCLNNLFYSWPWWVDWLFLLRKGLAVILRINKGPKMELKSTNITQTEIAKGSEFFFFTVTDLNDEEVVLSAVDSHLDASISVNIQKTDAHYCICLTTVVMFHNATGRAYFWIIKPFHILIMKSKLKSLLQLYK